MKTTLNSLLAAACLTLAATGVAVANQDSHNGKPDYCMKGQHKAHMGIHSFGKPPFLQGIALSQEQEDKVFALTHAEIPKMREQMKLRHQLHQALKQLSEAAQFDEAKAKQTAEKLATVEKENALSRTRLDSQVLALLTPEQREQVNKNKARYEKQHDGASPANFHRKHRHYHHEIKS